jgi:DNA-directed RNA polymerase subunit RPC12/RpoP
MRWVKLGYARRLGYVSLLAYVGLKLKYTKLVWDEASFLYTGLDFSCQMSLTHAHMPVDCHDCPRRILFRLRRTYLRRRRRWRWRHRFLVLYGINLPAVHLNAFNKTFLDSKRHRRKRCSCTDFPHTLSPSAHELQYECDSSRMLLWSYVMVVWLHTESVVRFYNG